MPFTIYLTGHGAWKPTDGFTTMPAGCSMNFMIHHAKTLPTQSMYQLCEGIYANQSKLERTIPPLHQVPNMLWMADEKRKMRRCEAAFKKNPISDGAVLYPNLMDFARQRKPKKGRSAAERRSTNLSDFFEGYDKQIRKWVQEFGSVSFVWCCCTELKMNKTDEGKSIGINACEGPGQYALKKGGNLAVESLL